MTELVYPELSYNVQGVFYDVYNELCYFELSEVRLGERPPNRSSRTRYLCPAAGGV